jgi:hypothetical protein
MNDVGYSIAIPPEPAEPDDWGLQGWRHSIAWCNKHVGEQPVDWWYQGRGHFVFKREQDRTMFVLRWGHDKI